MGRASSGASSVDACPAVTAGKSAALPAAAAIRSGRSTTKSTWWAANHDSSAPSTSSTHDPGRSPGAPPSRELDAHELDAHEGGLRTVPGRGLGRRQRSDEGASVGEARGYWTSSPAPVLFTSVVRTPYMPGRFASVRPVGPAPAMGTSVSCCGIRPHPLVAFRARSSGYPASAQYEAARSAHTRPRAVGRHGSTRRRRTGSTCAPNVTA